jgi:long-chain acyl-CoA synthetase
MSSNFWDLARTRPDDIALLPSSGRAYTFGEAAALAGAFAAVFAEAGLRPEDTISCVGRNEPQWFITYLAALQSGLYFTPLSPGMTAAELTAIWLDAGTNLVVAGSGQPAWIEQAAQAAGIGPGRRYDLTGQGPFADLGAAARALPPAPPPTWQAGMRALYTGGTTGVPRCIRRPLPGTSPEQAAEPITRTPLLLGLREGPSRHLVAGPLYHGGPLAYATAALHLGATLVLPAKWSAEEALRLIDRYRVNSTFMVPTMLSRLAGVPPEGRQLYDLSSLEAVIHGAAPCPPPLKHKLLDWLGPVLYEFYAATEGGGTYVSAREWLARPGTVGRALPGAEVLIRDEDDQPVPAGTVGRVTMRSNSAAAGGYFWPGDLGYLDDDGWLFLTDRVADVIITGGVNVYTIQVEAVLTQVQDVEQCAVIGVPDPDWGEAVTAVVVPRAGGIAADELERLLRQAAEALAPPQRPKHYVVTGELPVTRAGKVDKRALRSRYATLSTSRAAR